MILEAAARAYVVFFVALLLLFLAAVLEDWVRKD